MLADRAGMPMPKVAVINSHVPNAFATGRNPKNALVAVTTGIRERLSQRELEAVLGHEMAHVRNRDMRVLAIGNFLVTLTSFLMTMLFWSMLFGGMRGGRDRESGAGGIILVYLVTMVVYFVGQLLVLALTRYREYGADHSGAEISGDPGALASALEKISGQMAQIPDQDLRKLQTANAFLFAPVALKGEDLVHLFSTHPPVQERIRRLRELERRMSFGMR
jgi:heat shock protein HtpX